MNPPLTNIIAIIVLLLAIVLSLPMVNQVPLAAGALIAMLAVAVLLISPKPVP